MRVSVPAGRWFVLSAVLGFLLAPDATAASSTAPFKQELALAMNSQEVGTLSVNDQPTATGFTLTRTSRLSLARGATLAEMTTVTTSIIGKDYAPQSFRYERKDASGTLVTTGTVKGSQLELVTTHSGAPVTKQVALPTGALFASALEVMVRHQLKDGLTLERPVILEELGAVAPMKVSVKKQGKGFLIHSEVAGIVSDEQVDESGATVLTRVPSMGMLAYPVGRAPAELRTGKADLLAVSTWKTKNVPLPAERVVYKITTADPENFAVPADARQAVTKRGKDFVEVAVRRGPTQTTALDAAQQKALTQSTPYEAIDDPRIKDAANKAAAGATSKRDEVLRLTRFVYGHVSKKGLDRGYAPAIATLESKSGDCTEHSVLLSALLRSRGFATRLVDGVIVDGGNAGYHEWVEVYVDGVFEAADPTFGAFPAGPERLKLAQGSSMPEDQLQLSVAAARLLGKGVRIEVVEATAVR